MARFANYLVATAAALLVGKAVLLANLLPFLRRFDAAPLIRPILFKTVVYCTVVFLVRVLEKVVEYWFGGGTIGGIPDYVAHNFSWHWHAAIQIWIFVLFFIYTSHRTRCAARSRRTRQDILRPAAIEADGAVTSVPPAGAAETPGPGRHVRRCGAAKPRLVYGRNPVRSGFCACLAEGEYLWRDP
jgi:hypothetical protein